MTQPFTKLPWFIRPGDNDKVTIPHVSIGNLEMICADLVLEVTDNIPVDSHIMDAKYIVEAANNYPEAIELINYFVGRVELGTIQSTTTYQKYKDFLNKINDTSYVLAGTDQ